VPKTKDSKIKIKIKNKNTKCGYSLPLSSNFGRKLPAGV
jgi:hypothetical protein